MAADVQGEFDRQLSLIDLSEEGLTAARVAAVLVQEAAKTPYPIDATTNDPAALGLLAENVPARLDAVMPSHTEVAKETGTSLRQTHTDTAAKREVWYTVLGLKRLITEVRLRLPPATLPFYSA